MAAATGEGNGGIKTVDKGLKQATEDALRRWSATRFSPRASLPLCYPVTGSRVAQDNVGSSVRTKLERLHVVSGPGKEAPSVGDVSANGASHVTLGAQTRGSKFAIEKTPR
jgi:hypothetical protein